MFDVTEFYVKVEECCKQKGIKVSTMLTALGMSTSFGSNWKSGKVIPSAAIVKNIAEYLEVSTDYLLSHGADVQHRDLSENETTMLTLFEQLGDGDQLRFIGRLEEFVTLRQQDPH